jgi:hypothetical protein
LPQRDLGAHPPAEPHRCEEGLLRRADGDRRDGGRIPAGSAEAGLSLLRGRRGRWTGIRPQRSEGLRGLTLLEIDDEAVEAFRHRPAEDRAYYAGSETAESASIVFRRRQTAIGVREELLTWGARWTSRVPPNSLDQDLSMAEISPEQLDRLAAELRYAYYEILPERGGGPVALVRKAPGRPEEAAVGWPVWFRSEWLNQIAKGMIPYRARPVDEDTGERFVRRIARERSEYRYFMFLDDDQAIDAGRILVRATCGANGEPDQAEIQRADGTWDATDIFHRWRWSHEDRNPVEIPPEMAAASRR